MAARHRFEILRLVSIYLIITEKGMDRSDLPRVLTLLYNDLWPDNISQSDVEQRIPATHERKPVHAAHIPSDCVSGIVLEVPGYGEKR